MFTGDLTSEQGKQDYENYIMNNVRNEINSYTKQALANGVPNIIKNTIPVVTYANRPFSAEIGQLIYQSDTNEYLKYVTYGGTNQWMQADLKPNRNILINGDFKIWQRGTTRSFLTNGNQLRADRWGITLYQAAGAERNTIVSAPSGLRSQYCMRVGSSTVAEAAGGTRIWVAQCVESVNTFPYRGQNITLSFWVRFSAATLTGFGNFNYEIGYNTTTTDAASYTTAVDSSNNLTIANGSLPTTWTRYTLTGAVPAAANNIRVTTNFSSLSTTAALSGSWYELADVQLEVGTASSEFEVEAYETTLRKCQRYYENIGSMPSGTLDNGGAFGIAPAASSIISTFVAYILSTKKCLNPFHIIYNIFEKSYRNKIFNLKNRFRA